MFTQSDLDMARDNVAQVERHVALQRRIIAHLKDLGGKTELAEQLLQGFEEALQGQRARCERIALKIYPRPAE